MLRFSRLFRRSTLLTSGRRNRLELLITLNAHIVYNTWPSLSQRRGRRRRRQFMYYHKLSYEITVCYWLRYLLYSRQRTGAKTRRVLRLQKVMGAEYAVHHCLVLYSVFCSTIFLWEYVLEISGLLPVRAIQWSRYDPKWRRKTQRPECDECVNM